MTVPDAITEAVRHIREVALREAMAMVNRLQPDTSADLAMVIRSQHDPSADHWRSLAPDDEPAFRHGHRQCRMQIYDEIERMIDAQNHEHLARG